MARCPNCDALLDIKAASCPSCKASFEGGATWRPIPGDSNEAAELRTLHPDQPRGEQRELAPGSFWIPLVVGAIASTIWMTAATKGGDSDGSAKLELLFAAFFPIFVLAALLISACAVLGIVYLANAMHPVQSPGSVVRFFAMVLVIGFCWGAFFGLVLFGGGAFYIGGLVAALGFIAAIPFWRLNTGEAPSDWEDVNRGLW